MNNYFKSLPEKVKKRYMKKTAFIYDTITNIAKKNIKSFEPFLNVAITKNILNYRISFKYDDTKLPLAIEDSLSLLINKCLNTVESEKIKIGTFDNLSNVIDKCVDVKFDNDIDQQYYSYKYLFIGDGFESDIDFVDKDSDGLFYYGEYKNIKVYYIQDLENVYLTSGPILNFNNLSVTYNDTLDLDISNLDTFDYHKMIVNYNCVLGDVKLIEITK